MRNAEDEEDAFDDLLDELLNHPAAAAAAGTIFQGFSRLFSRPPPPPPPPGHGYYSSVPRQPGHQQRDPRRGNGAPPPRDPRQQRARRPPPRPRPAGEDPRVVLGFPPGSTPTKDEISRKRKQLAAIYHPDVGGNDEAMRRVNAAADQLLAELG